MIQRYGIRKISRFVSGIISIFARDMEKIEKHLQELVSAYMADWYDLTITTFEFQQTRKEFKGDITLVVAISNKTL